MAVSPSTSLRQSPGSSPKRNFRSGQIDENGYRLARLSRCPANLLNAPHMFRMIPIRRVHARHIHSGTDQPLDDSCSVGCRTQRADDLGSLPGGLGHSIVLVLQWLGTCGFEVVETIHACFRGRSIGDGSVATWKHFNLHGKFDFSDKRMVDSPRRQRFEIWVSLGFFSFLLSKSIIIKRVSCDVHVTL